MNTATEFEGRSSLMRKSDWLAVEDIDGLDSVEVTIEACYLHKNVPMEDGRKERQLYSLKFKGKDKQLILNATNRRRLNELFGIHAKDWKGKSIKLHVVDGVRSPKGGTTKGIRIV